MGRASRAKADRRQKGILPKDKKETLLAHLAASVERFYPERKGQFICPTCLRSIPIDKLSEISAAHIIPQSAGGTVVTLCCTTCNSTFGRRQDKWFGEYLHLLSSGKRLMATRYQTGRIRLGGVEVGGKIHAEPDGSIGVEIWKEHTSPSAAQAFHRMAEGGRIDSLAVQLPVLLNQWLVPFGFVTAAYLLWFKEFGYSWALQRHLDPVRKWILHPVESAMPSGVVLHLKDKIIREPTIGFGYIGATFALLAWIGDRLVLFPSVGDDSFFESIKNASGILREEDYQNVHGFADHDFGAPLMITFGDRMAIAPDIQFASVRPASLRVLHFPGVGQEPVLMHETTSEAVEQLRATTMVVRQTFRAPSPVSPEGPFTGRGNT